MNYVNSQNYRRAAAVTTSDTADNACQAIYVGGAGNVSVVTEGGDTVTFTAVPVGAILPVRCSLIRATGTTATALVKFI